MSQSFLKSASYSLLCLAAGLASVLLLQSCGKDELKVDEVEYPYIFLITADDLGMQLGAYGDAIARTPNLDQLAAEGILFHNAYVTQSSCSPSRSSMLTGQYPYRNGQVGLANPNSSFMLMPGTKTLPDLLKAHGYFTGVIGKVHVNPEEAVRFDFERINPEETREMDKTLGFLHSAFLEQRNRAMFMMINLYDPHVDESKQFPDQVAGLPEQLFTASEMEALPFQGIEHPEQLARIASYYNAVSRLDAIVGGLVEFLKVQGVYDQSMIIVMSDNGPPFTRAKTSCYEAGVNVPLIIKMPSGETSIQSSRALVSCHDLMPTILEAAGAPVPEEVQGRSMLPLLRGEALTVRNRIITMSLYHTVNGFFPRRTIRQGDWKLISNLDTSLTNPYPRVDADQAYAYAQQLPPEDSAVLEVFERYIKPPRYELYDLLNDPNELVNLAGKEEHAVRFEQLRADLRRWRNDNGDN